ncbi:hypothetical protein DTO169E5_5975 [Paecilomyces variotii]|nr:hypothetical protein DTO169E5_5975 [Paecilomyces variotii]
MCYRRSSIVDLGPGGWWFPIIVPCLVTAPVSRPLSFPTLLYPTLGLELVRQQLDHTNKETSIALDNWFTWPTVGRDSPL